MTRQRNDNHSTEFGLWLRKQKQLDSKSEGFVASNVDYIWSNYRTNKWMLIEEKRYNCGIRFAQKELFKKLHKAIKDPNYKGFYCIVFENTSPDDGKIYLDGKKISKEDLIKFLRFESHYEPLINKAIEVTKNIIRKCGFKAKRWEERIKGKGRQGSLF